MNREGIRPPYFWIMHLSKYCKIYPSSEEADSVILFSTKNAAIVELPASMAGDLPHAELTKKDRNTLKKLGFLVDGPEEERVEILGVMDELNELNKSLNIKLAMNLDCNLACRYCFEGKRKGKYYMSKETGDSFVDFVKERLEGKEEIYITFYGGEPLLSKKLIIYITKKVKSLADNKGIPFIFSFITNGTLLTKETVRRLKPLGMKEAYITIDGPKENHNSFRPYKTGKGSFETILRNIKDVCDSVDIQIGGNFTKDNFDRFPEFLDFLRHEDLTPSKVPVLGFFPILTESAEVGLPDFHDGCASLNEPWLFEANLFLREEILKRGHRCANTAPGPCMMEFENNILVNYDGSIYKCPGLIGRKDYKIGHIKTGIKDYRKSHNLDNWKKEECFDCSYLPLCFGGCRYMKFVREGQMSGVDCKKPYFGATLETLVKQDMRYGLIEK